MDRHLQNLQLLCRLCANTLPAYPTHKDKFQRDIQKAFDIDVFADNPEIYPPRICDKCRPKIVNFKRDCRNRKKCQLNIPLYDFKPHGQSCTICECQTASFTDFVLEAVKCTSLLIQTTKDSISLLRICNQAEKISIHVTLKQDGSWTTKIHGKEMTPEGLPSKVTKDNINCFLNQIDRFNVCIGNQDFLPILKTDGNTLVMHGLQGQVVAEEELGYQDVSTIRHVKCQILVSKDGERCCVCKQYRPNLFNMKRRRETKIAIPSSELLSSKTRNDRLSDGPLEKLKVMAAEVRHLKRKRDELEKRLSYFAEEKGHNSSDSLNSSVTTLIEEDNNSSDSLDSSVTTLIEEDNRDITDTER